MPIRDGTIFEGDVDYQDDLDTGYYVVLRSCKIGSGVGIWSHSVVDPNVVIGDNVRIQAHAYICSGTILEDDVFVGPGAVFLNDKYPPRYDPKDWQPPIVRKGAVIGGGAVICPGVEVQEYAKIGACAVVTKDVSAGETWVGVPARSISGDRKKLVHALTASDDDFKLDMLEAMGEILLMQHWMRGLLTWLRDGGLVATVLQPGQLDEFSRVLDKMSVYEDYVWETLPPRAMVQQLRKLRQTGAMDHEVAELLIADSKGRWDQNNLGVQNTMREHYLKLLGDDGE